MKKILKIGVLGCGPRGIQFGKIIRMLPEYMELTAMSDVSSEHLKKATDLFPGIDGYESSDALLEAGVIDAVIVEVPPSLHLQYVVKALSCGYHVLGEIPVVDSIEEGNILWTTVQKSSRLFMCGANANFHQKSRMMLELDKHDLMGNIAYVEAEYIHDTRPMLKSSPWRKSYESCRYCTHSLGPVLALLKDDEIVSVSCMGTGDHFSCGIQDNAMSALYRTRKGVVMRILTAFGVTHAGPHHTTRIHSEKGEFIFHDEKMRFFFSDFRDFCEGNEAVEIPFGRFPRKYYSRYTDQQMFDCDYGHGGADFLMLESFVDAILNRKSSPLSLRQGLSMTLPGIYAAESAKQKGKLVKVEYPW